MTVYTFTANSTAQSVDWDNPSVWAGGVVPNSAEPAVDYPCGAAGNTSAG